MGAHDDGRPRPRADGRLRQGAGVAAEGPQRQVGGADGDQRRAGHLGQHHRPGAGEAAQRRSRPRTPPRPTPSARRPRRRSTPRRATCGRSCRCCRATSRTPRRSRTNGRIEKDDVDAVVRASSDDFWRDFDRHPLREPRVPREPHRAARPRTPTCCSCDYVGHRLPGLPEGRSTACAIVDGAMVPAGKRGFLFSKYVYEDQLKLKAARRLDKIKEGRDSEGLSTATDPDLKRMVRENVSQVREILLQLDAAKTADFRAKLQTRAGQPGERRRQAAGGVLPDRRPQPPRALRLLLQGARALAGALPRAHRRRADHQGVHALGLRAVGERAGLRRVRVPGAREVDAGGRAEPDGHGLVPRALRLHERREAGRDPAAAKGGRRPRRQPRERRSRAVRHQAGRGRRAGRRATSRPRRPRASRPSGTIRASR